jgi:UDP-N-acetylmuramoyl-L-alanyl-D-glutamate--2,6-diaminopimelate ligase
LIGAYNVENVLLAAATAFKLGFAWSDIVDALAQSPQIPGRMERVWATGLAKDAADQPPVAVFVDYSHTPDSIEKALAALSEIKTDRVLIVFGCGGDRDRTKRPLMAKAALHADYVIITSDNPRSEDPLAIIEDILEGTIGHEDQYVVEPDRAAAIALALSMARPGDLVLIAGKGHEDYQIIGKEKTCFSDAEHARRAIASHTP